MAAALGAPARSMRWFWVAIVALLVVNVFGFETTTNGDVEDEGVEEEEEEGYTREFREDRTASTPKAMKTFLDQVDERPGVVKTASGLRYFVHEKGHGTYLPTADSNISIHVVARRTPSGKMIVDTRPKDSPFKGYPLNATVRKLSPGWAEASLMMVEGAMWHIWVIPELQRLDGYEDLEEIVVMEVAMLKITGHKQKVEKMEKSCNLVTLEHCTDVELQTIADHEGGDLDAEITERQAKLEAAETETMKGATVEVKAELPDNRKSGSAEDIMTEIAILKALRKSFKNDAWRKGNEKPKDKQDAKKLLKEREKKKKEAKKAAAEKQKKKDEKMKKIMAADKRKRYELDL